MTRTLVTGCNRHVELQSDPDPNRFSPAAKIDSGMCSTPGVLRNCGTLAAVAAACEACPFGSKPVRLPAAPVAAQPFPTVLAADVAKRTGGTVKGPVEATSGFFGALATAQAVATQPPQPAAAQPTQAMTPRCGIPVQVVRGEHGGFELAEPCAEGQPVGLAVATLLEHCGRCPRGAAAEAAAAQRATASGVAALEDNLTPPPADPPAAPAQQAGSSSLPAGFYPVLPASSGQLSPVVPEAEVRAQRVPVQTVEQTKPADEDIPPEWFAGMFGGGSTPPPSVDALLAEACPWHVAGGSILGMSKLKVAKHCLRRFCYEDIHRLRLKVVQPYQGPTQGENAPPGPAGDCLASISGPSEKRSRKPKEDRVNPLELGTLVHACLGRFYVTANVQEMWAPAEAVKAYYPELALECRRLVAFYLRTFNPSEAATWDIRAVEHESRYYWPARKCHGKRRSPCTSARHDTVYRKRAPGENCIPVGQAASSGVRLHELKTTGSLTGGRIRGFFQNAQIMMNLLAYTYGHSVQDNGTVLAQSSAELIGPTDTVTVSHIGKNKAMGNLDISRNDYVVPEERIFGFRDDLQDWLWEEIFDRLFSDHWQDPLTWRKDWICADLYYQGWICPYTQLCEAGAVDWTVNYYQKPDDGFRPEALELPPKLEKQHAARMSASAQVAEGK